MTKKSRSKEVKKSRSIHIVILLLTCLLSLIAISGCGGGGGAPPKVGSAHIDSEPEEARGAAVYINNILQNKETPALIENLSEGQHTLGLTKEGWKDYTGTINVIANDTVIVNIPLQPKELEEEGFLPPNVDFTKL